MNKSSKFKFSSIISVILCLVIAILVWLLVGYTESGSSIATADPSATVYSIAA